MTGHSSANDIISTFNHFFTNVPTNKSFDMTYKVYIRDLVDMDDRGTLSSRSSMVNVQNNKPVTIASHGIVPTASPSCTTLDASLMSMPGTKASSTNLSTIKTNETISMTQIDRLCAENMARKERSMVDLKDLNQKFGSGCPPPPPCAASPPTVYENLSILSSKSTSGTSSGPNTFTEKVREFEKLIAKKEELSGEEKVFIKISDCFE
ncbi:unnamed protein product [Caenorhabditis brenneri]